LIFQVTEARFPRKLRRVRTRFWHANSFHEAPGVRITGRKKSRAD
jgi:hypothetical protein